MNTKNDTRIIWFCSIAFAMLMLWGYVSGDLQNLFRHRTPEEAAAAEQRALDRMFGSDQAFDPSADNVTTTAEGKQDNVSWKTLAHAKLIMGKANNTFPEGVDFAPEVQKLDGNEITITGYIFPLQASGDQVHFLLSAYPPSCPYCLPGTPTELIEVTDSDPVKFTYEPITVHGTFKLLRGDALKEGMFYRMTHVHLKQPS